MVGSHHNDIVCRFSWFDTRSFSATSPFTAQARHLFLKGSLALHRRMQFDAELRVLLRQLRLLLQQLIFLLRQLCVAARLASPLGWAAFERCFYCR